LRNGYNASKQAYENGTAACTVAFHPTPWYHANPHKRPPRKLQF
jgi:hypothetical protein